MTNAQLKCNQMKLLFKLTLLKIIPVSIKMKFKQRIGVSNRLHFLLLQFAHVIVSDDLDHDKKSVTIFNETVANNFVKKNFPQVKVVDIFSDGPTSQFKNKYMVGFYHTLQRKGLKI